MMMMMIKLMLLITIIMLIRSDPLPVDSFETSPQLSMLLSTTFCMLVKILPSLTSTKAKFFCSLIVRTHPMMMMIMMMIGVMITTMETKIIIVLCYDDDRSSSLPCINTCVPLIELSASISFFIFDRPTTCPMLLQCQVMIILHNHNHSFIHSSYMLYNNCI